MELNGKTLALEINDEFKSHIKTRWPWLNIQQFHRDEKIRIVHDQVVDHNKINDRPQVAYENFFPCAVLLEATSMEKLIQHVEEHVLVILAGLDPSTPETFKALKFYIGFTDIVYVASDDGDEYERFSTAIGLIRMVGEHPWTTLGHRAIPVQEPEPTEAELVQMQAAVDEMNRYERVERIVDAAKEITKPVRISIQGGESLSDAVNRTYAVLGRVSEIVHRVENGTYMKVSPEGIDYADTLQGAALQLIGFENLELEVSTEPGTRHMIHLMAGDENWTPTSEELQELVELFRDAQVVGGSVISTSNAVKVKDAVQAEIVYVEPGTEVTIERVGVEHTAEFIDLSMEEVQALQGAVKPGGGAVAIGEHLLQRVVSVSVEYGRLFTTDGKPVNNKVIVKYQA